LTVFVAGPMALWICWMLSRDVRKGVLKKWFWMIILATAEIYGGESLISLHLTKAGIQGGCTLTALDAFFC
jgi:hypothetical protein